MHCGFTYPVRMLQIDRIMLNCRQNRVAAVRLNLLSRAGGVIMFSRHLRQQTISKPERRESEDAEFVTLQQFGIDRRSRNHNFCSAQYDSWNSSTIIKGNACEHLRIAPHLHLA